MGKGCSRSREGRSAFHQFGGKGPASGRRRRHEANILSTEDEKESVIPDHAETSGPTEGKGKNYFHWEKLPGLRKREEKDIIDRCKNRNKKHEKTHKMVF